jgi:hypothetical protein
MFQADPFELAEHLEVLAAAGEHAAGLEQQLVEMAMGTDPGLFQQPCGGLVAPGFVDAVFVVPVHGLDVVLAAHLEHRLGTSAQVSVWRTSNGMFRAWSDWRSWRRLRSQKSTLQAASSWLCHCPGLAIHRAAVGPRWQAAERAVLSSMRRSLRSQINCMGLAACRMLRRCKAACGLSNSCRSGKSRA